MNTETNRVNVAMIYGKRITLYSKSNQNFNITR